MRVNRLLALFNNTKISKVNGDFAKVLKSVMPQMLRAGIRPQVITTNGKIKIVDQFNREIQLIHVTMQVNKNKIVQFFDFRIIP